MSTLTKYLRTHRRRSDLSHDDIALLLTGKRTPARFKRKLHEPTLRAAMAYEVIFRISLKGLFPNIYEQVEHKVTKRARELLERVSADSMSREKRAVLMAIAEPPFDDVRFEPIARV